MSLWNWGELGRPTAQSLDTVSHKTAFSEFTEVCHGVNKGQGSLTDGPTLLALNRRAIQMTSFTDDEVLQIFEDLPNHLGCSPADLDDAEQAFGAVFPKIYRRLMLLDERRMLSIGWILPIGKLKDWKHDAEHLLTEDEHEFQLEPQHVVFAWYDIHSFYFFAADGSDDVPVYRFNYYSDDDDWLPVVESLSVREFLIQRIRSYLKLNFADL